VKGVLFGEATVSKQASNGEELEKKESLGTALRGALKEVTDPFVNLVKAPRALWGINVSYLLEGLVYFGILTIIGKYLSENVGLSDLHAGWVLSVFTGGITLAMLFLGGIADRIGVRKALLISLGLMLVGRILLGISGNFALHQGPSGMMFLMVAAGLAVVVVGYGMYQPAAYAGVKQFTNEKTATIGYAMIYGLMNLGAFASGILSPPIREQGGISAVFWTYAILCAAALSSVFFILTPKVVKRDTLTQLDRKKEDESGAKTEPENKIPILSLRFGVLLAGVALSIAAAGYLWWSAPKSSEQRALSEISLQLEQLGKELNEISAEVEKGSIEDLSLRAREVSSFGVRLEELSTLVVAPQLPEGATAVIPTVFSLLSASTQKEGLALQRAKDDPEMLVRGLRPTPEVAAELRTELRILGLFEMAAAEATVRPVDAAIIEGLQRRFSDAGEELIPVEANRVQVMASTVKKDPGTMLRELAFYMQEMRSLWERRAVPGLSPLLAMLDADASFLQAAAVFVASSPSEPLMALVRERMISMSTFLIRDVAPAVGSLEDVKAKPIPGVSLLTARLVSSRDFASEMPGLAGDAIEMPIQKSLAAWALRYGLLLLAGLLFLGGLVVSLLGKRPDHPFNNSRFVFLIFILIPVQTLFAHNWLTLPYYINRAFGGTFVGEKFEFFSNINPVLIFVLSPMVAALTARAKVYSMLVWGTLVMALPTFLLVVSTSPAMLIVYILLMSIGEAMWQPRFLQWVAEIAPEGKTGAYMGIAQFPWFLTKVITGTYSGYFLSKYIPMVGPQNPQALWLLYGFIAMVSPVGLVAMKRWANRTA